MGNPSLRRIVDLFLKAAKPAGEYSGIQTFVSEKPSKGIQDLSGDSTSHPPGESPKSDRDRAKPQRTDTKENLERHTPSNTVFNVPGPSDDAGPNPKTNITVRSPGTPGEEYGHPFKENIYPRRTAGLYPPYSDRQHDQRGDAKRYYKRYYRENKSKTKLRAEKRYKKLRHSPSFLRDKERRNNPMYEDRFHRLPAGGVRSPADRSKEYREEHKVSSQRVAETFYREVFTKGNNLDPGKGVQDLGRPSQYAPILRYPDTDHNSRSPAESMNNIREVDNNPGSAKVIPDGHGFENKKSSSRVAARAAEILRGVDRSVESSAKGLTIRVVSSDPTEGVYRFAVQGSKPSPYEVKVQASTQSGETFSTADIRVSCTCDFWRWQGPEHWAKVGGYLLGDPRGTAQRPLEKDPKGRNRVCKHAHSVLSKIQDWWAKPTRR